MGVSFLSRSVAVIPYRSIIRTSLGVLVTAVGRVPALLVRWKLDT
jgi:hypothetical protein